MKKYHYSKNLIKTGIFACIMLLLCPAAGARAEEFSSEKDKFSLSYDSSFVPVDIKLHNVALAVRSKTGFFPTFNVVIEAASKMAQPSKSEMEKSMLDDYRLVGIKDVSLVSSDDTPVNSVPCFRAVLAYSMESNKMRSNVAIFTGVDRRYILTFIDSEAGFEKSKIESAKIIESFKLREDARPSGSPAAYSAGYLLPALALIVVMAVLIMKFLHSRKAT